MTDYTKTTNFAAKDSLPSGNANKIVKGAEIDTEFTNIATASATKANIAGPTFTGTVTIPTADINGGAVDGTTIGAASASSIVGTTIVANTSINIAGDGATVTGIKDEDDMSSNSATKLATQQSIKAYVDSQVTAQDLDVTDGSSSIDIDLDSESLGILGGTGIDSTASGTGVTLAIDSTVTTLTGSQTLTNKTLTAPTLTGTTVAASLDISGDVDVDGTLETDALSINGTTVTSTAAELNILDGVTSTAAELNILDGVTSTTAELNILDGVTATAAELNIMDGVTATTAELNIMDGVTSTAAELNILDGVTSTTAELNILDGVTSTAAELNILDGKAFLDEDDMSSNSATGIASQQSIKAYVDAQITAEDLDFQADSGGALSIDLDSETLTFTGGTGIDTSGSGNAVTFAIDSTVATLTGSQTLTNKSLTAPTLTGTAVVASLDISGDIDVDGTTNLDVVDIDGAVDMASTLTVGSGIDVTNGSSSFNRTHSTTTSSLQVLNLKATSSGDMADGFGPSIVFAAADTGTTSNQVAEINVIRAGSDTAFNLELQTADATRMTIGSGGVDVTGSVTADGLVTQATANTYPAGAAIIKSLAGDASYITNVGGTFLISNNSSSDQFALTSGGNVGIGTSSITSGFKLEVTGDARFGDAVGDDAVELGWSSGGSQGFIQAYDRGASAFRDLSINNAVTVTSGGSVTADGSVTITGSNEKFVSNSTSSGDYVRLYAASGTGKWDIYGNGANLRISDNDSAGSVVIDTNVGIGDSNPQRLLSIKGTSNGSMGIDGSATSNSQIAFKQGGTDKAFLTYWDSSDTLALTDGSANGLHFSPSSGSVGIGTDSPTFNTGSGLEIQRAGPATLRIEDTGSGGKPFEIYVDDAEGYVLNGRGSGMPMYFKTVNQLAMTIDTNQNVGIGTSAPNSNGGGSATVLHIHDPDSANWAVTHYTNGTTGSAGGDGFIAGNIGSDVYLWNYESSPILFATAATERMRIDSSGAVTKPYQPAFMALRSGGGSVSFNAETTTVFALDTEVFDQGADYNNSTYQFTAPVTGKYQFNTHIRINSLDASANYYIFYIRTSNRNYYEIIDPNFSADPSYYTFQLSALADMDANDVAYVEIYQAGGANQSSYDTGGGANGFSGYLVA